MEENTAKNRTRGLKTQWKKGESGNPNGRPAGTRNFLTIYKEAMQMLADKNHTTPEALENEIIANASILARKGNYSFYKDFLDRTHGTALQRTDVQGNVFIQISKEIADKHNVPTQDAK